MTLDFIPWTPTIYYSVVAGLLSVTLIVVTGVMAEMPSILQILAAIIGSFALAFFSHYAPDLHVYSLIIFVVGSFLLAMVVSKAEALTSIVATICMAGIVYSAATFLVSPRTGVTIHEVGGLYLEIHHRVNEVEEIPSESESQKTNKLNQLIEKARE